MPPLPSIRLLLASPRARRWGILGLLLAGALVLLWRVTAGRSPTDPPLPPSSAAPGGSSAAGVRIRVVDPAGQPLGSARVRCRALEGAAPEARGSWSPEAATLTLPPGHAVDAVLAVAPGFRPTGVADLSRDQDVMLHPGPLVRIALQAEELPTEPSLLVVLLVRPLEGPAGPLSPADQAELAALIALAPDPGALPEPAFPTGQFGFAVGALRAGSGIRVPVPGRYEVRWGLFDRSAGVLFALDDEPGLGVDVTGGDEPQDFAVPASAARLAAAKEGLASRVRRVREEAERGTGPSGEGAGR